VISARGDNGALSASGISHLVVEVSDVDAARAFYGTFLGVNEAPLETWPGAGEACLRLPSGQMLVLAPSDTPRCCPDTGVHQAYRVSVPARNRIEEALNETGVEIARYHEDRPGEGDDAFYFSDPDGNRIQLVAGDGPAEGLAGIDHAAVQAADMEWEESFYVDALGLPVDHRVGWNTADFVRAQAWAAGKEEMAPGTRRIDERYRANPGADADASRKVARPNVQLFLKVGDGVLGIFLAVPLAQEPPPEQALGSPRVALMAEQAALEDCAAALSHAGATVEGPIIHPKGSPIAASVYFRDPCGNLLELAAPAAG
jgi:catechol 2,3-dioxygenase-like lactoylglutathione lyase family enzyme